MLGRDRGDRGAIAALAILVAGVVAVTWINGQADNEICAACSQNLSSNQNQEIDKSISAYYPWRDTYAQWLMAFFSIVATAVSIWAVRLVRESLSEAQRATKAAFEANEISREIGRSQTRAYISIKSAEAEIQSGAFAFYLDIENSGQTPAKKIRADCNLKIETGEVYNYLSGKPIGEDHIANHKPVFAGDSDFVSVGGAMRMMFLWVNPDIKREHFDKLLTGKGLQLADFKITWSDVFDQEQTIVVTAMPDEAPSVSGTEKTAFFSRRVHWPKFKIHYHQLRN